MAPTPKSTEPEAPAEDPASKITPFHELITQFLDGQTDDEMTSAILTVIEAVNRYGKKGSVNLKIEIKPAGTPGRQVFITPEVTAKPPEPDPFPSIFFVGNGGTPHREDPFSGKLDGIDGGHARQIDTDETVRQIGDGEGSNDQ